jgi:PAS domain-containing protein
MESSQERKDRALADLLRIRAVPPTGKAAEPDTAPEAETLQSWALGGHYEQMLDALPVGVLMVGVLRDRHRYPTGYRMLHANSACLALLRMDMLTLGQRSVFDVLPGGEDWKAALDGVALRGHPVREVGYSTLANGYFDVAVSKPLRDVLTIVLSEVKAPVRRQANDAGDEFLFQDILEAAPLLICRFLTDGTLTYANPAYRARFGSETDTLVGHCFLIRAPLVQRDRVQRDLLRLEPDHRMLVCEHEVYDGATPRTYTWHDVGVFDKEGQLVEILAFGAEETDRKRKTDEMLQLRGFLEDLLDHRCAEVAELERRLAAEVEAREQTAQSLSEIRRERDFAVGRALGGELVICEQCHRVNDDEGHWMPMNMYLISHTAAHVTTDVCPYCKRKA